MPNSMTTAEGDLGVRKHTRSPRTQPTARNCLASRLEASSSSAYLIRSSFITSATASGRRPACLVTNCCNNSAILRFLCSLSYNHVDVRQLLPIGRDVEDERAIADGDIFRQLLRHAPVAPDQVRAIRLVVLERRQPVR